MELRTLGTDGPRVSRLCLGTNNFGGQLDENQSRAVLTKALDMGINMLDTSDVYNEGRSEEIIGRFVRGNRNEVLIATKVGILTAKGPRTADLSRKYIERQMSDSLKRLKTDYVDFYYVQRYDPDTPLEETLRTLDGLVKKNKVRHLGVSNFTVEQLDAAMSICEKLGLAKPVVVQPRYNLLDRHAEKDLFPYCATKRMSVLSYSPLWGGFLTGKYRIGAPPPPGSRGQANKWYWDRVTREGNFKAVERLEAAASGAGISLARLALAWVLRNPAVTAPIVGASAPEQLSEYSRVLDMRVPESVFTDLESAAAT